MAPTQRQPEQQRYRGELSQACRIDLLDSGEPNSESLRSQCLSLSPLAVSSSLLPPLGRFCIARIAACTEATGRRQNKEAGEHKGQSGILI